MQQVTRPTLALPASGSPACPPVPGTPEWNAQFGPGYTALFFVGFSSFVIPVVVAVISSAQGVRFKLIAVAVVGFATTFACGIVYIVTQGIGIPINTSVLHPRSSPVRYWLFAATGFAVSLATAVFAAWCYFHANVVAEFIARHPPSEG